MALRITGLGEEIAAVTGLPWNVPLEEWPEDPALAEKRGISRHVVRLVRSTNDPESEVYAVKETVSELPIVSTRSCVSSLNSILPACNQSLSSKVAPIKMVKNYRAPSSHVSCRTHFHIVWFSAIRQLLPKMSL
jgi:hypothetical protein